MPGPGFAAVVNAADLATADGMPVLKVLQWFHTLKQDRVAGNDLLPALLERAASQGWACTVRWFGGYPAEDEGRGGTRVADPPLRRLPCTSLRPAVRSGHGCRGRAINATGAQIVMVSLGCPKQERWMAAMKGRVNGVMLGLGGAFLLYSGVDTRAPRWMRDLSLEWLYRFMLEPRRLWKRYLVTNTQFLLLLATEVFRRLFTKRQADVK